MPLLRRKKKRDDKKEEEPPVDDEDSAADAFQVQEDEEEKLTTQTASTGEALDLDLDEEEAGEGPAGEMQIDETGTSAEGSLFILNHVEDESIKCDNVGNISERKASGQVWVDNASNQSSLKNITINLSNTDNTTIALEDVKIVELQPQMTSSDTTPINYDVSDIDTESGLLQVQVEQGVVQDNSNNMAQNFIYGTQTYLRDIITVTNPTDFTVQTATFSKTYPSNFTNIVIKKGEGATVEGNSVNWSFAIDPGQSVSLTIDAGVIPRTIDGVNTGNATLSYELAGTTISGTSATATAFCETNYAVEKQQDDKDPSKWIIKLEFSNVSEFPTKINKIALHKGDINGEVVQQFVDLGVGQPGQTWADSVVFFTENIDDVPTFGLDFDFVAVPDIQTITRGNYDFTGVQLPVGRVSMAKDYVDPNTGEAVEEVICGSDDPIITRITATNDGTAVIDRLDITDASADGFVPPNTEDTNVYIQDSDVAVPAKVAMTPDDPNAEYKHDLQFLIDNMMESIGGLQPEQTLVIEYPIVPKKARPGRSYRTVPEGLANTQPVGPDILIEAPPEMEVPQLKAIHKAISVRVEKSVSMGDTSDQMAVQTKYSSVGKKEGEEASSEEEEKVEAGKKKPQAGRIDKI